MRAVQLTSFGDPVDGLQYVDIPEPDAAVVDRKPVHVPDLTAAGDEFPEGRADALRWGHRTVLSVPLLRENEAIGSLSVRRIEVRPFSDKQIELAATFADQAVIAIENVRLFDEVQARTRDLSESLEQQTATSEVLRAISSSSGALEPVFQAILENATRICDAKFGMLYLWEGEGQYRVAALHGAPPRPAKERRRGIVIRPAPRSGLGRVALTKHTVHIADVGAEKNYTDVPPGFATPGIVIYGGARTVLAVPMLKEKELIGAIGIYRQEVRPFTEKQIELVTSFAAQAVIAIENTRLLNELRQRTDDLSESLQQQARLCDATQATIWRQDGEPYKLASNYGYSREFEEFCRQNPIFPKRTQGTIAARTVLAGKTVHIPDIQADPEFSGSGYLIRAGFRTGIGVPLLREGVPIGVFVLTRPVVKPFTEKQIELVTTFADQAVIAIENVRLLNELRESLQQQTATADVLKVISRSTFDLKSVLNTLVESAARLCQADMGNIARPKEGGLYQVEASYGQSASLIDEMTRSALTAGKGSVIGRTALNRATVHILDAETDPDYEMHEARRLGGYHTMLGVPLLREGNPIWCARISAQDG
jgi:two-component system, NtrC family, sensor kinase